MVEVFVGNPLKVAQMVWSGNDTGTGATGNPSQIPTNLSKNRNKTFNAVFTPVCQL